MTGISYETTAEDIASKSLHVTVDLTRLDALEAETVQRFARQARIAGFRKGHIPEPVIRRRFDPQIRQSVLEAALRESWQTIVEETDVKAVGDPQVRQVRYEAGQPLQFDLLIEIRPSLTLEKTGGFALTRTVQPVTDEAVQEQLDRLREQHATWRPVEGNPPREGQLVSVTVTTLEEGKNPGPGQMHDLILGQGQTIPEMEERIMGLHAGETTETDVHFPADHSDAALRGTARRVRITLHEIKEQVLPALDDAFAREIGDFDSVDALRKTVHADLEADAARDADARLREELIARLAEANAVPAPPSLVHRLLHLYAEGYQIDPAQFESFSGSFRPVAEAQVKRELILDAVTTAQNLRATEADIDARVAEMAARRGIDPGKLYASLEQGKRLGELERSITEEKTFAWLLEQSTVTEGTA
jgi:trigger factor